MHLLRRFRFVLMALVVGVLAGCSTRPTPPAGSWPVVELSGSSQRLAPDASTKALVFAFIGVECPIANRFLPELIWLQRDLAPRGVRLVFIYPNADESPDRIRRHLAEFTLTGEVYRDPGHELARQLDARVTPEVVALTPDGRRIYQGRVNDQFTALGRGRPAPAKHDLADALEAFLAGEPPADRHTAAVGCTFR